VSVRALQAVLLMLAGATPAWADPPRFGLVVGEPNGATAAWTFAEPFALHVEVGHSLRDDASLLATADLVWRLPEVIGVEGLVPWVGAGARFSSDLAEGEAPDRFGVRVPAGISYWADQRVELFFEVAPALSFVPESKAALAVALGIRVALF
jgi:hypothetical protein